MSETINGTLGQLAWMLGPWSGSLDVRTVQEDWQRTRPGSMETMVRLSTSDEVQVLELIAIRAFDASLKLHLRQFTADLNLFTNLDMSLRTISDESVTFGCDDGNIRGLGYTLTGEREMRVDVTIASGDVLSAHLTRD